MIYLKLFTQNVIYFKYNYGKCIVIYQENKIIQMAIGLTII